MSFIDRSQDLTENRELSHFLQRSIPTYKKRLLLKLPQTNDKN